MPFKMKVDKKFWGRTLCKTPVLITKVWKIIEKIAFKVYAARLPGLLKYK